MEQSLLVTRKEGGKVRQRGTERQALLCFNLVRVYLGRGGGTREVGLPQRGIAVCEQVPEATGCRWSILESRCDYSATGRCLALS